MRLGDFPKEPDHQFVGRSRELLSLERLLGQVNYAVICGQGGEGKTTLAAELARWLVRTQRFDRAAFVSVEDVYDVRTVVDRLGRQMKGIYSVAQYDAADLLDKALHPIEQQIRQYHTLIVLDNMESILPSGSGGEIDRFEPKELERFFQLCQKLLDITDTALLFTSRKPLPQPFHVAAQKVTLGRLHQEDAIQLVHQAMRAAGLEPKEDDTRLAQPEEKKKKVPGNLFHIGIFLNNKLEMFYRFLIIPGINQQLTKIEVSSNIFRCYPNRFL